MTTELRLQGFGAAAGVALGPACVVLGEAADRLAGAAGGPRSVGGAAIPRGPDGESAGGQVHDKSKESSRFTAAVAAVGRDLDQLIAAADQAGRAIVEAHRLILTDPDLQAQVEERIAAGQGAREAVEGAVEGFAAQLESLGDAYFRERAADVRDVGRRLRALLCGRPTGLTLTHPCIIVAGDLSPTETIGLDRTLLLGIVTEQGGPTSHTCILARTWGIPAVVAVPGLLAQVAEGAMIAMDGSTGQVIIHPSAESQSALAQRPAGERAGEAVEASGATLPAKTPDGHMIELAANAGSLADVMMARERGAQGIGLLRTEFLFMGRAEAPNEEEQYQVYRHALAAAGGERVVIRTLDVGGDKEIPYLDLPREANPFLGCRGLRLCFRQPELFQTQLRALLRAAAHGPLAVMFPMVAGLADLRAARAALTEAAASLTRQAAPWRMPEVGIMIEIPSAALIADRLAPEVDFFSIGTNDLTQYTLAVDRGNPDLAASYQPYHPAVLSLIDRVVAAAHARGKWVGVCGEMAGQPLGALALLGLGVDELSMAPPAIPAVRRLIRQTAYQEARATVQMALQESTAEAVQSLLMRLIPSML